MAMCLVKSKVLTVLKSTKLLHEQTIYTMQKPISLDMILYGDSDISYVQNITLFNIVHEYIVKTKDLKIINMCI